MHFVLFTLLLLKALENYLQILKTGSLISLVQLKYKSGWNNRLDFVFNIDYQTF